jgi:hypothetical protein
MALEPTFHKPTPATPPEGFPIPTSFVPLAHRLPARAPSRKTKSRWLGPCASVICLIHCFSIPFILLLAPSVFHFVPFQFLHELELIFWVVALDLGIYSMKQAAVPLRWQRAFVVLALLVPPTVITGPYYLTQALLASMALMQFVLVFMIHRDPQEDPECCHDH